MKKILLIQISVLILVSVLAAPGFSETARHKTFSPEEIESMKTARAILHTRFGDITIEFFPEAAPNHVDNFIQLAQSGFYNGTTFHRIIPGFMIQGGDPLTKSPDRTRHGTGGPGYRLKAEFNDRSHTRGAVSMARSPHPDSAGSQFFICVADAPHLDRQYTVFGKVVSGMEVVDKIVAQPKDARDNPMDRIEMKVEIVQTGAPSPGDQPKGKPQNEEN